MENYCFLKNDFNCSFPDCKLKFKFFSDLREHFKKHIRVEVFICSKCHKRFTSMAIIQNHIYSHIKNRPFSCFDKACKSSFINKSQLKFHFKIKHFPKKYNYMNDEDYDEIFNKLIDENKEEIEGKLRLFEEENENFLKKYPILDMNNEEDEKKMTLLQKKRKDFKNKLNLQSQNDTFETCLSKEEKIIYFLLKFVKDKVESECFDDLVLHLDKIED